MGGPGDRATRVAAAVAAVVAAHTAQPRDAAATHPPTPGLPADHPGQLIQKNNLAGEVKSVLWIQIQIGSVFTFQDSDLRSSGAEIICLLNILAILLNCLQFGGCQDE